MAFFVTGQPLTLYAKLTGNTLTTVFSATKRTTIVSMAFTETGGGTDALTVLRANPTPTNYYFRNALAVTAKQRVLIDETFALNNGDTIKAQSAHASGNFDVMITYLAPDAATSG